MTKLFLPLIFISSFVIAQEAGQVKTYNSSTNEESWVTPHWVSRGWSDPKIPVISLDSASKAILQEATRIINEYKNKKKVDSLLFLNNKKGNVIYTGSVPQCPYCKNPTYRTIGISTISTGYYPPVYNEKGVNTNHDCNTTTEYECLSCKKEYEVITNCNSSYYSK